MNEFMEEARKAVRDLDKTHNLRLHLGEKVTQTLETRIATALAERDRLARMEEREKLSGLEQTIQDSLRELTHNDDGSPRWMNDTEKAIEFALNGVLKELRTREGE